MGGGAGGIDAGGQHRQLDQHAVLRRQRGLGIDPAVAEGTPASVSRAYSVAAQQLFRNPLDPAPNGSYNAELVIRLSPEMQQKIRNSGTPMRK